MKIFVSARAACFFSLALFLFQEVDAQQTKIVSKIRATDSSDDKKRVRDYELHSKLMSRHMAYRVVFPARYFVSSDKTKSFPVIYLLHGLSGNFRNWTEKTKLAGLTKLYDFIVVTPEGGDGWYTDSASKPNDRFETYIIQELIPDVEKNFRVTKIRESRAIAGLSMGGYGAIKFGLKYPEMFSLVGSFSGALDAPLRGDDSRYLRPSIISVFGESNSLTRKDNDIFRLIRESDASRLRNLPFLYFDCGTEDWLFKINREFADLLVEKKVPHEFRELPGTHVWNFWNSQVQEFFRLAQLRLK